MPRRRKLTSAREKVLDVIRWARAAGFVNVAATLPEAVTLMPPDDAHHSSRRQRP